jgi:PAS domain-containing protein
MPVIDDIEALKNAEQALRESEIRMRALLDASQDEIPSGVHRRYGPSHQQSG